MNTIFACVRPSARIVIAETEYPITPEIVERMLSKIAVDPETNCWEWLGARSGSGYGAIRIGSRLVKTHRLSYSAFVADIPDGLVTDHLCRNRACLNPNHLELVTHAENIRRGDSTGLKTHCKRGHELSEENVYVKPSGRRECRTCRQASIAKFHARKKSGAEVGAPMTHCRNGGHEWIPENIYTNPNGGRQCRICRNASIRKHDAKFWKPSQLTDN